MFAWPLSFLIALRFSCGRRARGGDKTNANAGNPILSLLSVISTLGITLGVAVLILGLSAMNGFERELKNRVLAVVPHGKIAFVEQPFNRWPSLLERIEQVTGIIAAAPYIEFTGLIESGSQLRAVQIKGVDPQAEKKLSALPHFMINSAWDDFRAGEQQIILGKGLADALGVTQGAWLTLMISNNDPSMKLLQPKRIRLRVAGLFQLSGQLDHSLAMLPLVDAQQYLEMGQSVTGIAIKVSDVFNAHQLTRDAAEVTQAYVQFSSWMGTYGYMYRDIQMIRSIMYLAMILVIGVASFNIVSTLVMAVNDKSRDIAILRTLGAKDSLIRAIFIWYGLLTGLVGSLSGVIMGSVIALKLTAIISQFEKWLGRSFLSGDIYFIDFLPSELHASDVIYVLITAILLSLLASWYPARCASRLDPVRVLSGR